MRTILILLPALLLFGCAAKSSQPSPMPNFQAALGALIGGNIRSEKISDGEQRILFTNTGWLLLPEAEAKLLLSVYQKGTIVSNRFDDPALVDWKFSATSFGYRVVNQKHNVVLYLRPDYLVALPSEFDSQVLQAKAMLESTSGRKPAPIIILPSNSR